MASASARPKGVRPPGGGFFRAAVRCSCSDRQPAISAAASFRCPHRLPALSGLLRRPPGTAPASRTASRRARPVRARVFRGPHHAAAADRCKLAFRRPAPPTVAPLFGSPSGRPAGSLRGSRSWFSFLAHTHLLVISDSFSSQFGVQENPRARDLIHVLAVIGLILFPLPSLRILSLTLLFTALGGLGTTVCYHRVLAHRTLKLNKVIEQLLVFWAMFNGSGAPASWVAYHRNHHSHTDTPEDISSPKQGGFWWAHLRWLYQSAAADRQRWCPELNQGA